MEFGLYGTLFESEPDDEPTKEQIRLIVERLWELSDLYENKGSQEFADQLYIAAETVKAVDDGLITGDYSQYEDEID